VYVPKLFCSVRPWKAELNVIASVRAHMLPILKSCQCEDFERPCLHSLDGPLTLAILLERITMHIPHHIAFIEAKLRALGV
jgi:hypothetical protein